MYKDNIWIDNAYIQVALQMKQLGWFQCFKDRPGEFIFKKYVIRCIYMFRITTQK